MYNNKYLNIFLSIVSGIATLLVVTFTASAQEALHIDQFISSDTCKDCHSEIFDQWENSMHYLAHKDPVYSRVSKFLRKGLTD